MKRALINMSIEDAADMEKVVGEFEAMGAKVVYKTYNYLWEDWIVDLPDDKVEDLHKWLEKEGYDGPWNNFEESGFSIETLNLNTQFPLLVEDGGVLARTVVSADGATFGVARMPDGTWSAYPERSYFEATGLAALCGAPTQKEIVQRVHAW
jgi:hypothetical protein